MCFSTSMSIPKGLARSSAWALAFLCAAGCGGSLPSGAEPGGGGSSASGASDPAGAGGFHSGGAAACGDCPSIYCAPGSTPATKPGDCCPLSCANSSGGSSGAENLLPPPSRCQIDLQTFEKYTTESCPLNERAGVCSYLFLDNGKSGVCGSYHLYSYGYDGFYIECDYDSVSGDLVGGITWGPGLIPNESCSSAAAGPAGLQNCPSPSTPFCTGSAGATSADGGAAGADTGGANAGEGGSAGAR
jgi:hypothetical protein